MEWSRPIDELIRERRACRAYEAREIETDTLAALQAFLTQSTQEANSIPARFVMIKALGANGKVGTYGMISGAQDYIVGITTKSARAEEFGYAFEKIILFATGLGLSTCWLAGIDRKTLEGRIDLGGDEVVAVASPVGYAKASARDGLIRMLARGGKRKPFGDLFFEGRPDRSLTTEAAGKFSHPLEMARLAPSASNKQPWRVILDGKGLHFCIRRANGYDSKYYPIDIQKNDVGIAMCNFALAADAQGLKGEWTKLPDADTGGLEYVKTWRVPQEDKGET